MVLLFNFLALFYVFRGLKLAFDLWQARDRVLAVPLTAWHKAQGEQAAFFLAVPVAVAVHELGHALAIWAFGGQVVEFGYRVFWGYVVPAGTFTPAEDWFISLAGTLGSLVTGIVFWLVGNRSRWPAVRYFALRALRFQIFFSLIYYPIFSAFGLFGDWVTIYGFGRTPLLSGLTAAAHAGILALYWRADRRGIFEMPAPETEEGSRRLWAARQMVTNAGNPEGRFQLSRLLSQMGAPRQARHELTLYLARFPRSPRALVELATLQTQGQRTIPRKAVANAEKALKFGLSEPAYLVRAHTLVGSRLLDMGQSREALPHLDAAIAAAETGQVPVSLILFRNRALARRQLGQLEGARADIERALDLARATGAENAVRDLEALQRDLASTPGRRRS